MERRPYSVRRGTDRSLTIKNIIAATERRLFGQVSSVERQPVLIPFYADSHPNSTVGLMPPDGIRLDDGGWYKPSRAQLAIWDAYLEYWSIVESKKRELNAFVSGVFGGDGSDDNKHSDYQLVTKNEAVIIRIGAEVQGPALQVCDELNWVRGTEAHGGDAAWQEELIAQEIGAVQDQETGNYTSWEKKIEAYDVAGLFAHHPPSNSLRPWTKGGGANRAAAEIIFDYGENEEPIPDFAAFAHVHHFEDSGYTHRIRVVFTAPFCLSNAFVHRIGKGWQKEIIGAWIFTVRPDGTWGVEQFKRKPIPRKVYTVPICLN